MHDNDKTTDQLPSLTDVLEALYKPGTVYDPKLKLKPVVFDIPNSAVKKLDVSVVGIQNTAEVNKALHMINDQLLDE